MTAAARERLQVRAPLLTVSGGAWLLLFFGDAAVCSMPSMRLTGSTLMFAAMMLPLLGTPLCHVRDRSLTRRRLRAIALFAGVYAAMWIAAGVVLLMIADRVSPLPALAVIAAWQFSPWKQRCLNRLHAHPKLSAFGLNADLDVLRFGAIHALWCIASCFALMLLPMLLPRGQVVAMAAVTVWLAVERLAQPVSPRWRWREPAQAARTIHAIAMTTLPRA
jgi:predicted metal-binding membrane protein